MSIEDNEHAAVRGLLGTAFAAAEPPLRDLASGSIARGDAARRRNRMVTAGGAVLSAAAVIGTFAMVTGAPPPGHDQPQVQPMTPTATSVSPSGPLNFGPEPGGLDKNLDIERRLPALLQPLLPAGITSAQQPSDALPDGYLPTGLLTGPTGTNQVTTWVGGAPGSDDEVRQATCSPGGACTTRTVADGTVYLDAHSATATDFVRGAGLPADVVKAGTGGTVVSRTLSMVFVPTDRSKYAFSFTEETQTASVQYANHAPSDYMTGGEWPPQIPSTVAAHDPSGLLMSADDLVAMLGKPGLDKVEYLIDPRTAVSQETRDLITSTVSQIAAAAQAALPSGSKVGVDISHQQARLMVTGPTGKNELEWSMYNQSAQYRQQTLGVCPPNVTCTKRSVAGGTLLIWAEKPMDSKGTILATTPSSYEYWLYPDDTGKQVVTMTLDGDAAQTGLPGKTETDPGQTYSVNNGPYAPAQMSADQFLAVVQSGQLAAAITKTNALLGTLQ